VTTLDGLVKSGHDNERNLDALGERGARLIDQGLEGLGLADRDVGENLPINFDAGEIEAADKSAIGQPVHADGSVDALNPKSTESPLPGPPISIGVLAGFFEGLTRGLDEPRAGAVMAPRALQNLLVLSAGRNAPFDP